MQTAHRRRRGSDQIRTLRHVRGPADCRTLGSGDGFERRMQLRVEYAETVRESRRDDFERHRANEFPSNDRHGGAAPFC